MNLAGDQRRRLNVPDPCGKSAPWNRWDRCQQAAGHIGDHTIGGLGYGITRWPNANLDEVFPARRQNLVPTQTDPAEGRAD